MTDSKGIESSIRSYWNQNEWTNNLSNALSMCEQLFDPNNELKLLQQFSQISSDLKNYSKSKYRLLDEILKLLLPWMESQSSSMETGELLKQSLFESSSLQKIAVLISLARFKTTTHTHKILEFYELTDESIILKKEGIDELKSRIINSDNTIWIWKRGWDQWRDAKGILLCSTTPQDDPLTYAYPPHPSTFNLMNRDDKKKELIDETQVDHPWVVEKIDPNNDTNSQNKVTFLKEEKPSPILRSSKKNHSFHTKTDTKIEAMKRLKEIAKNSAQVELTGDPDQVLRILNTKQDYPINETLDEIPMTSHEASTLSIDHSTSKMQKQSTELPIGMEMLTLTNDESYPWENATSNRIRLRTRLTENETESWHITVNGAPFSIGVEWARAIPYIDGRAPEVMSAALIDESLSDTLRGKSLVVVLNRTQLFLCVRESTLRSFTYELPRGALSALWLEVSPQALLHWSKE